MNRIQYMGDSPAFVDDFAKGCERSCKGSLHLFPKRLLKVTDDELEHLKSKRKDIFRNIKVLPKTKTKPEPLPKVEEKQAEEKAPEPPEPSMDEAKSEEEEDSFSFGEKKKKKKKSSTDFS